MAGSPRCGGCWRAFGTCRLTRTHAGPARGLGAANGKNSGRFPPSGVVTAESTPTDAGGREASAGAEGPEEEVLDGGQSTSLLCSPVRHLPSAQRARAGPATETPGSRTVVQTPGFPRSGAAAAAHPPPLRLPGPGPSARRSHSLPFRPE